MKHTIKEQTGAVNYARRNWKANVRTKKSDLVPFLEKLNDAASTLAALNLIGQDVVLIAPELTQEVQKLIAIWNAPGWEGLLPKCINKLTAIINRLPK